MYKANYMMDLDKVKKKLSYLPAFVHSEYYVEYLSWFRFYF